MRKLSQPTLRCRSARQSSSSTSSAWSARRGTRHAWMRCSRKRRTAKTSRKRRGRSSKSGSQCFTDADRGLRAGQQVRGSSAGSARPGPPRRQLHHCERRRSLDMFAGSAQIGGSLGRARIKSNRKTTMARLAGRKIIITGGASGIGRATARLFRREGAAVAILDRSDNAAKAVADEIGAVAIACDVSDPASVTAAVNKAAEALVGLDGVINAAGILAETGIADTTAEVFSRTLAVNLTGTFLVIQAAAPLIQKAGKGTIVNIASGVGLMPTGPGSVAYVASKGGVVALTKSVAMELAPNIRVNSVCPGAVETAMTAGYIRTPAGDPNPAIIARYAMGRHAQPEELAAAILFLTSDESSFMTGIPYPSMVGAPFIECVPSGCSGGRIRRAASASLLEKE